jgi:sporulation protein YlmC with PRC-barrel domain
VLITHVRANELLGKKVYDKDGRLLGEVTGIAGRHGVLRAVVLRHEDKVVRLPARKAAPYLKVLH